MMDSYTLAWKVIAICAIRWLPYLVFATPIAIGVAKLFRVNKWI